MRQWDALSCKVCPRIGTYMEESYYCHDHQRDSEAIAREEWPGISQYGGAKICAQIQQILFFLLIHQRQQCNRLVGLLDDTFQQILEMTQEGNRRFAGEQILIKVEYRL